MADKEPTAPEPPELPPEDDTYTEEEARAELEKLAMEIPRLSYAGLKETIAKGKTAVRYLRNIHSAYLKMHFGTKPGESRRVVIFNRGDEPVNVKQKHYAHDFSEIVIHQGKRVRCNHLKGDPVAGNPLARHGLSSVTIKPKTKLLTDEEPAEVIRDYARQKNLELQPYDPRNPEHQFETPKTFDEAGVDPSGLIDHSDSDTDAQRAGLPGPGFLTRKEAEAMDLHNIPDGEIENLPRRRT